MTELSEAGANMATGAGTVVWAEAEVSVAAAAAGKPRWEASGGGGVK